MRRLLLALVIAGPLAAQSPPLLREVASPLIPPEAGAVLGLADFDGDGDLDLLTHGTGIYLNDANGRFAPHPVPSPVQAATPLPGAPFGAASLVRLSTIGDFTGDGNPDVVVSWYPAATPYVASLELWVNQGGGVLASAGFVSATIADPMALASGDVDADGDLDLVVSPLLNTGTYPTTLPLALLLNNGTGAFAPAPAAQMPATPMAPRQLALADFDGDGLVDLLAGVFAYGGFPPLGPPLVFLNAAPGASFTSPGLPVPASPAYDAVAVGDVDGNGLADLVLDSSPPWGTWTACGLPSAPAPLLLFATGGGSFWPAYSAITGPLTPGIPRLVDLTGDGVPDLLRLTYFGAEVYPLSVTTVGALAAQPLVFPAPEAYPTGNTGASIAVGDVDGDGDRDVVTLTPQGNQVIFNDSAGSPVATRSRLAGRRASNYFWNYSQLPTAADVDGDGDPDLILGFANCGAATKVEVAWNDGLGNLMQDAGIPCPSCGALNTIGLRIFFDADQDGDTDAFVQDAGASWSTGTTYRVLLNSGGSFVVSQSIVLPSPSGSQSLASGDLDGDGDLDVVGGFGIVFKNVGGGSFQASSAVIASSFNGVALADLDGDGDLDGAFAGWPSGLLINDGTGSFTVTSLAAFPSGYEINAADFDGDGDADLLFEGAIYVNQGSLSFSPGGAVPLGTWYPGSSGRDLLVADADGDGDSDVLNNQGWLYRNSGTGTFAAGEPIPLLTYPIVVADFDRDGDLDLVSNHPRILTNMTRQLSRGMPARPGRPASLELGGPPGAAWELYASPGTTSFPLPPFGTVRLDLAGLQLAAAGTIGPNGLATLTGTVPTTPGIVGTTVYWQAVVYHPYGPRLTGLEVTTVAAF